MHYTYLQYYLHTHIFGNIEFALNHFKILKQSKAKIIEDSKTLLIAYFKFELARLDSPNSTYITVLPAINLSTPYDVISGPGISTIMNSIYELMNQIPTNDLLPEMTNELIIITRVLSSMANSFWFPNASDKSLCSKRFLELQSKFTATLQLPVTTSSQHEYFSKVDALYKNGYNDEYVHVHDNHIHYSAFGYDDNSSNSNQNHTGDSIEFKLPNSSINSSLGKTPIIPVGIYPVDSCDHKGSMNNSNSSTNTTTSTLQDSTNTQDGL